jgi:hypothetical protein
MVPLTRLIAPRGQTEICADIAGFCKSPRIVDNADEGLHHWKIRVC